jgi:peptide/nickel transport system permease protein
MLGFIVRRLFTSVFVLFLASILVFVAVSSLGDPLAELRANPRTPPSVIEAKKRQLNLDKPVPARYALWLKDFVSGDLGEDNRGREIAPRLRRSMELTLRMAIGAAILAALLAMVVGVYSAVRQYTISDYFFTFVGFLFLSTPVFWLAGLLKLYGAIEVNDFFGRTLVYTQGAATPGGVDGGFFARMGDYASHSILPILALALISFAAWSRYQRATMLDVLNSDYVRLARAKGLSNRRVLVRHALRNALIPLVTVMAIDIGAVFAGAVITETVFNWSGMGRLFIDALRGYESNVLLAWMMVTGVFVILFNLAADLLYGVLDPRIRV